MCSIVVPGTVLLGLGIALLIESGRSLRGFYRAIHFLPFMATLAAMAIAWEALLHPTIGLVNQTLFALGLPTANWLRDEATVLPTLAVIGIWQNLGFAMVLFLAGLKSIPQDLYDAADIDGADQWIDRLRTVTLPMLGPVSMFVVIVVALTGLRGLRYGADPHPGRAGPCLGGPALHALSRELRVPAHRIRRRRHPHLPRHRGDAHPDPGPPHGRKGALPVSRTGRRLSWPAAIARHALLLATGALLLVPFVWMASLSLKPPGEIFRTPFSLLPDQWYAIENYGKALTAAPLPRYMAERYRRMRGDPHAADRRLRSRAPMRSPSSNSRAATCSSASFSSALLLPHQVLALPLFILGYGLGILDSYAALILPFVVSPFGIFLFRQFFRSIPDEVVHAARLDGLSEFAIVWRIMLPMAMPAVIAFSIFSVVAHWNDLFWPLIAVKSPDLMPPALGVVVFRGAEAGTDYGPLMAGAVLVVLPLLLAFAAAQRWFIEGLTSASLK